MVAFNTTDIYGRQVLPWNIAPFAQTVPMVGSFFPHGEEIAARYAALQTMNPWLQATVGVQNAIPQIANFGITATLPQLLQSAYSPVVGGTLDPVTLAQLQSLRMSLLAQQQLPVNRFAYLPQLHALPVGFAQQVLA